MKVVAGVTFPASTADAIVNAFITDPGSYVSEIDRLRFSMTALLASLVSALTSVYLPGS